MMNNKYGLAILVVSMMLSTAWATGVYIANPSFEDDSVFGDPPANWTLESGAVANTYNTAITGGYPAASNGSWRLTALSDCNDVGVSQTLSATLQANTTYTFSVDVFAGDNETGTAYGGLDIAMTAGANIIAKSYNEELTSGEVLSGLSTLENLSNGNSIANPITVSNPMKESFSTSTDVNQWYTVTLQFTTGDSDAGLGEALSVYIRRSGYDPASGRWTAFDNVQLDAVAAPEPATMALMLVGGVAAIFRRKKH